MRLIVEHEELDALPWILPKIGKQISEGYLAGEVGGAWWRLEGASE